jgi:serine/threonine-protein kinase
VARELVANRYRLDERLGVGGMAEVWAADDIELGRRVAIKLLGRDADPARFEREAQAVAAVAHPNICQLYDYGEEDGRPFMVLEYLAGGTLEDRLVAGDPYPDDETERIAGEVAAGLAHAHDRGLVHRDLKPANVLFDSEGRAKIADFGLARMGGAGTLTETGTLLGTAAYISPEQAQGLPATPASDVYSFGVILYRMLTGRLPFEAENPIKLATMHVNEQPPPVGDARPDAPAALARVTEAALAKDPGARPADGAALVDALGGAALIASAPTGVLTDPTLVIPRRPARPRRQVTALPLIILAVIVLAAAGIAVAVFATRSSDGTQPTAPISPGSSSSRSQTTRTTTASQSTAGSTTKSATSAPATHTTTQATTAASSPSPPASTASPPPSPPPPPPPPPPTTAPTTATLPATTPPPPPPP